MMIASEFGENVWSATQAGYRVVVDGDCVSLEGEDGGIRSIVRGVSG